MINFSFVHSRVYTKNVAWLLAPRERSGCCTTPTSKHVIMKWIHQQTGLFMHQARFCDGILYRIKFYRIW